MEKFLGTSGYLEGTKVVIDEVVIDYAHHA